MPASQRPDFCSIALRSRSTGGGAKHAVKRTGTTSATVKTRNLLISLGRRISHACYHTRSPFFAAEHGSLFPVKQEHASDRARVCPARSLRAAPRCGYAFMHDVRQRCGPRGSADRIASTSSTSEENAGPPQVFLTPCPVPRPGGSPLGDWGTRRRKCPWGTPRRKSPWGTRRPGAKRQI